MPRERGWAHAFPSRMLGDRQTSTHVTAKRVAENTPERQSADYGVAQEDLISHFDGPALRPLMLPLLKVMLRLLSPLVVSTAQIRTSSAHLTANTNLSIRHFRTSRMAESSTGSSSRIVVVGVGGATCSGKTTLAKHLLQILNPSQRKDGSSETGDITDAFILHQDDFAPPEATLPVNEEFGVTDWDHPPTAVGLLFDDDITVYCAAVC